MAEVNILGVLPKIVRDAAARVKSKAENRAAALKFGREYFDGTREQGYGGYVYDGRWIKVAHTLIDRYHLRPGMRVLDVGCAKGFLVKDLSDALPGLDVFGLDVSDYALRNAHPDAKTSLLRSTADYLPFADGALDFVSSINTIHNLDRMGCIRALKEMERVSPGRSFVQVDAYRTEAEKTVFEQWMLTAKTYLTPEGWLDLFKEAGYKGDWYWTVLELDSSLTLSNSQEY